MTERSKAELRALVSSLGYVLDACDVEIFRLTESGAMGACQIVEEMRAAIKLRIDQAAGMVNGAKRVKGANV